MPVTQKKISELPLASSTTQNTVTIVSQGGTMATYKIGVNDLIKNADSITSKASASSLAATQAEVDLLQSAISEIPPMGARLTAAESAITTLQNQTSASNVFISPESGIKYTNYNGVLIEL